MASIDGIIDAQAARAEYYGKSAEGDFRSAISAASGFTSVTKPIINWSFRVTDNKPVAVDQSVNATYVAPKKPASFDKTALKYINPISALRIGAVPDINIDGLFSATQPTITTPEFAESPPVTDFDALDAAIAAITIPIIRDYESPILSNITIGTRPDVTVPTFSPSTIVSDPGDAGNVSAAFQTEYDKALPAIKSFVDDSIARYESQYAPGYNEGLAKIEAKLVDVLDNGSILPATYEQAIYARARARTEIEHNRVVSEVESAHRKRGFVIPPASMMSGISQATQAAVNNLAGQSTDIAIKRAELEIQQAQFALATSAQLRESMRSSFLQYAGLMAQLNAQADDHAKAAAGFLMDVYRVNLDRMARLTELLRTEAAIYETYLKASLAQLDIYKMELESAKLNVEVDSLKIEAFTKSIAAEQSRIEMFVSLLKSVEVRANLEKSKIEVYGENVKAYVSRLSSDEIKTKIYTAALQGDELKLKAEMSKLETYTKEMDAEAKRVSASVDIENLKASQNKLLIDIYKNDLDAYKTEIGAESARFDGTLRGQMAVIEAYIKNLQAKLQIYESDFDRNKLELDKAETQAKIDTDVAIKNADLLMSRFQLQANITKDIGAMYGNMAGSALSSQNTMVSQVVE